MRKWWWRLFLVWWHRIMNYTRVRWWPRCSSQVNWIKQGKIIIIRLCYEYYRGKNFLLNSLKSKMFLLLYSIAVFLDLFLFADYLEQKVNFWTDVKNGYFDEHFYRNLQKICKSLIEMYSALWSVLVQVLLSLTLKLTKVLFLVMCRVHQVFRQA